ncbi:uroporphyrinogen-III C-methyltransferase [Undibacter mobilis]|uniref:Uroporphyrinogen-III C-methyltransferase n=2 Tax=Undibacter mobilis TaxID=2292256 RepID=A0A371BDQ3_9BRAD|nr:uroporphyrinogen-III C-methyltransferase [Undibacter mobilis]
MGALARLPVFFALSGRRALVAGGTAGAAWKVELLLAAGAHVAVYAAELSEEMQAVIGVASPDTVAWHARAWQAGDFAGTTLAVGACNNDDDAARFAAAARATGTPVNVIDKPDYCDFSFGSIVNRSPLVVGISTDGAAPVFAQAVRAKIEAALPHGFAAWAAAARAWRARVKESGLSFAGRRKFWQLFAGLAIGNPGRTPTDDDLTSLIHNVGRLGPAADAGSVTLVGAGPGDPELLTLRAVRALQTADVILFDDLVSGEVLDFARREARKILVGKQGHGPSCKQSDVNDIMVSLARQGRHVVRLKGGDPLIFGRAGEEIAACHQAGISVDIVPGVSAVQGAASRLGVSLTGRGQVRRLQLVTGHAANGELPDDIDWRSIADGAATTAIYMPVKTLAAFVSRAIAAGLDAGMPAVAIANATRPSERRVMSAIGALHDDIVKAQLTGPVLVIVGRVLEPAVASQVDVGEALVRAALR